MPRPCGRAAATEGCTCPRTPTTEGEKVAFDRIDTDSQPQPFISGIAIDPADPNHAFVSFSGYNASTPQQPGHVFDVHYDPATSSATWTSLDATSGHANH